MNDKGKFFYNGFYFQNQKDFWEYIKYYEKKDMEEEDLLKHFKALQQNIRINFDIYQLKILNEEAQKIFEKTFLFMMTEFFKEKEQKNE